MSRLQFQLDGVEPGLLMHAWQPAKLLTFEQEDERLRIIRKTESKRSIDETENLHYYDTLRSLWLDSQERPCIPQAVIRTVLESGARTEKSGGEIRSNVIVESTEFTFDEEKLGTTPPEWGRTLQFNAGVKVGQVRHNRSRALFPLPWSVVAVLDVEDLDSGAPSVDATQIERWLKLAGRRVGIGDWRPAKSGVHGRFVVSAVEWLDDDGA